MKPDLYTKAVLTLIAALLAVISFHLFYKPRQIAVGPAGPVASAPAALTPKLQANVGPPTGHAAVPDPQRPSSGGEAGRSFSEKANALDSEARAVSKRIMDEAFTKCGSSYYFFVPLPGNSRDDARMELKGVQVIIRSQELTEADSLNGLQWKGYGGVKYSSWRRAGSPGATEGWLPANPDGSGSKMWDTDHHYNGGTLWPLEKKNGKWLVSDNFGENFRPLEEFAQRQSLMPCP